MKDKPFGKCVNLFNIGVQLLIFLQVMKNVDVIVLFHIACVKLSHIAEPDIFVAI